MVTIHKQLIQNAITNVPCVGEFHRVCPDAQILLYFDGPRMKSATIQATEIIYDRYEFTLTIKVKVDSSKLVITSFDTPLITLIEDVSVTGEADGPINIKHGENFKISPDQLQKIVEAGGQFSAAGIALKTNEPVSGIEELKAYLRRPPIQ
jgi:hypothetical protein